MPRQKNVQPAYLHHTPTNQAYCRIHVGNGKRKVVYLGEYGSAKSKTEYRRILAELDAAASPAAVIQANDIGRKAPRDLLFSEMYLAFWKHAQQHYRRADGTKTDQLSEFRQTFRLALELYGSTPAREFGPLALKAVRQKMIEGNVSRSVVNDRCRKLRFVFKWAAGEELVPVSVYQSLACVAGLQKGRTNARETEPRRPVDDALVDVTLPHLNRYVRGLVQFQRLTGCRPGEAMALRRCDIDTSGTTWLYKPDQHKTAHKGKARTVAIGPKAQELLKGYFTDDPNAYLFNARRAAEEFRAENAANRKTPRYPSHMQRNEAKRAASRKRPPRERYTRTSYLNAVTRACDRAFPLPEELARLPGESVARWKKRLTSEQRKALKRWQREHRWCPYQIRHTFATMIRRKFDLESAQVVLGHERADVTQIYAARNDARAAWIAEQIG